MNSKLLQEKVDLDVVYARTLKHIKRLNPEHKIFKLEPKEQKELLAFLLKGQGYYVREGIKNKVGSMALPGLGKFMFNPLRVIVNKIRKELTDKLEPYEVNQLIKEALMDFFDTHQNPFKKERAQVYSFDLNAKDKKEEGEDD